MIPILLDNVLTSYSRVLKIPCNTMLQNHYNMFSTFLLVSFVFSTLAMQFLDLMNKKQTCTCSNKELTFQ